MEKKRPGAVKGHKGYHRPLPDHVDKNVTLSLEQCPGCWSHLGKPVATRSRIIEDIPEIRPVVTEYTMERYYCNRCRKIVEPPMKDALPNASLSLRSMIVMRYMKTV